MTMKAAGKKLYRQSWLSTDRPAIPHQYSTNSSLIHCQHATNAITTTCRSICRPIVNRYSTKSNHLTRPSLDWHLTNIATDMLTEEISADTSIDTPCKTYIWSKFPRGIALGPRNHLGWESVKSQSIYQLTCPTTVGWGVSCYVDLVVLICRWSLMKYWLTINWLLTNRL